MNRILSFSTLFFLASTAWGYKYVGAGTRWHSRHDQPTRAAACAPATGLRDIEWNNVSALIETGGSLWQDRATSQASYEVPKGGGVSSLYAGALWMGGISPDQQLKLAAVTFRGDGNDYWAGPLTNDGSAEVDATTCNEYDDFFVSTRADAQRHRQYFDAVAAGTVEEEFPEGYAMPAPGLSSAWQLDLNQDYYLAPFRITTATAFTPQKMATTLGTISSRKSIARTAVVKTSSPCTVTETSTGFSTTKATSTRSRKVSQLAWRFGHKPSPFPRTTR